MCFVPTWRVEGCKEVKRVGGLECQVSWAGGLRSGQDQAGQGPYVLNVQGRNSLPIGAIYLLLGIGLCSTALQGGY